jgi:uncharacterized membrane protein
MDQSALIERLERISEQNPALVEHARKRAESIQNQIADRITKFAGSMHFVYLHVVGSPAGSRSASRRIHMASSR